MVIRQVRACYRAMRGSESPFTLCLLETVLQTCKAVLVILCRLLDLDEVGLMRALFKKEGLSEEIENSREGVKCLRHVGLEIGCGSLRPNEEAN